MNVQNAEINLNVDFCSYEAAKYAVLKWHYSKCMPSPPHLKFGIWENNIFIGSIIYSRGASSNIGKPYNLLQTQVCELTRIALNNHKTFVSKLISMTISIIKNKYENIQLIISYADYNQNHLGKIYQATNFIYTGMTSETYEYYDTNGKKYHSRQISEKGYNIQFGNIRKCKKPSELIKTKSKGKFRYLMPLNKKIRRQIIKLSKPYPKELNGKKIAKSDRI
jgi:hypothetical protein